MTVLFSQKMNFDHAAQEIPETIIAEAHDASRSITDPDTARALFDQLIPVLETCKPNRTFALACGMLMEKQRNTEGMLEFWTDLLSLFPDDLTALRMLMRWYRRSRMSDEGIQRVQNLFPESHQNAQHATKAIVAYGELRAFREIDEMVQAHLNAETADRSLRMRYIKSLSQQSRYFEAREVASGITDAHKMGQSSQDLLALVSRRAAKLERFYSKDANDIFDQIISLCPIAKPLAGQTLGTISFFTGQLGTGGAERQLTRIATELNKKFQSGTAVGNVVLDAAPTVCVRHANAASGGDFFLPILRREHIRTHILSEMDTVDACDIPNLDPQISALLELLPADISDQTRKLIRYFQMQRTKVAYLWQDGGVLSAATAALIAGVPRIVTSFRGLPPNLRPNLMRSELEPLYNALGRRPEVTFSANSKCAAVAYENWLNLPTETIEVIPNAIPKVLPDGDESDQDAWNEVISKSRDCNQTVMGIFRFDENKRPIFWIEAAAKYAAGNAATRFVIVGSGHIFATARRRIEELNMQDRIFFIGIRKNVGFYLHRADVIMHLAAQEGLPNVLIEAHLAGKPVLATPAGGTDEVVSQGSTGHILSSAADPSRREIQTALHDMFSNPERLARMGKKALSESEPKYLPEHVLARTAQLFLRR